MSSNLFQKIISDPKFDPYEIFSLSNKFTMKRLTKQYHKKALRYHPDKGGDALKYNIVMYAYKILCEEHAKRTHISNGYREMKKDAETYHTSIPKNKKKTRYSKKQKQSSQFNVNQFNEVFNDNSLQFDDTDNNDGYDNWINTNKAPEVDENRGGIRKVISNEQFNNQYSNQKCINKKKKQIVVYKEPEPIHKTKLKFSDVDLSTPSNYNQTSMVSDINFRDYKEAYTNSQITNVKGSSRVGFSSVDELQNSRSNIQYDMSEHGKMQRLAIDELQKRKESQRINRIRQQNLKITNHYGKVNALLLK